MVADEVVTFDTVALTNLPVPGAGAGINFDDFEAPTINSAGQVAFFSIIDGPGVDGFSDEAVFAGSTNSLQMIVRKGDEVEGLTPGTSFLVISQNPLLDEFGHVGFLGAMDGPGINSSNDLAIFSDTTGSLQAVVREGNPAPGTGAFHANIIQIPSMSNIGQIVFAGNLSGAGVEDINDTALFSHGNGPISLLAREGDPAPGAAPGVDFVGLQNVRARINANGHTVFHGNLSNGGSEGLFTDRSGILQSVALAGTAAPGTELGVNFIAFSSSSLSINSNDQIAFHAYLVNGGGAISEGIFSEATGALQVVALEGEDAPGIPVANFLEFSDSQVAINSAGETAFNAILEGFAIGPGNDQAIYLEKNGQLELVAQRGTNAPDTPTDVRFGDFDQFAINNSGQMVFQTLLIGAGTDATNNSAIFTRSNGQISLIAREGDWFDVNDDPMVEEMRVIQSLDLRSLNASNGADGVGSVLNDSGQIAMRIGFDDGTAGIFVANLSVLVGDVNGDGQVDLLDVAPFIEAITSGTFVAEADINGDGSVDLLDVGPFVDLLTS